MTEKDIERIYCQVLEPYKSDTTTYVVNDLVQIKLSSLHPLYVAVSEDYSKFSSEDLAKVNQQFWPIDSLNSIELFDDLNIVPLSRIVSLKDSEAQEKSTLLEKISSSKQLQEFNFNTRRYLFLSKPFLYNKSVYIYVSGEYGSSFHNIIRFQLNSQSGLWQMMKD